MISIMVMTTFGLRKAFWWDGGRMEGTTERRKNLLVELNFSLSRNGQVFQFLWMKKMD